MSQGQRSSPTTPTTPPMETLQRVTRGYTPRHQGELQLRTGDVVAGGKELGNGWTVARNVSRGDRTGIFPSACVEPLEGDWPAADSQSGDGDRRPDAYGRDGRQSAERTDDGRQRYGSPNTKPHLVVKPREVGARQGDMATPPRTPPAKRAATPPAQLTLCAHQGEPRAAPPDGDPSADNVANEHADCQHADDASRTGDDSARRPAPPGELTGHYESRGIAAESMRYAHRPSAARIPDYATQPRCPTADDAATCPGPPPPPAPPPDDGVYSQRRPSRRHEPIYYQDYRTLAALPDLNPPPHLQKRPRGGEKLDEVASKPTWRVLLSVFWATLIGGAAFLATRYAAGCRLWVAVGVGGGAAVVLALLWSLSRLARCVSAILLPSLATTRGRLAVLLAITGLLLAGPARDLQGALLCHGRNVTRWEDSATYRVMQAHIAQVQSKVDNQELQQHGAAQVNRPSGKQALR